MSDEIKEILDYLKKDDDKDDWGYVKDKLLAYEEGMKLVDCITNLQQIEQDHQKLNGELRKEIEDYKSRNEKAIEKIKKIQENAIKYGVYHDASICQDLLNTLGGGDKDVKD